MTGTITSAADLLRCGDCVFLGFLREWERNKRVDLPLADYLTEWDLPLAAEAVKWLATSKDRPTSGWKDYTGPFPLYLISPSSNQGWWFWRVLWEEEKPVCALDLPRNAITRPTPNLWCDHFESQNLFEALCLPLDLWKGESLAQ